MTTTSPLMAEAKSLYSEKKFSEALQLYNVLAEQSPDDTGVLHNRALCLAQMNQWPKVAADAKRLLKLKPSANAHFLLGRASYESEEYQAAYEHFTTALTCDSKHTQAHKFLQLTIERIAGPDSGTSSSNSSSSRRGGTRAGAGASSSSSSLRRGMESAFSSGARGPKGNRGGGRPGRAMVMDMEDDWLMDERLDPDLMMGGAAGGGEANVRLMHKHFYNDFDDSDFDDDAL